MGIRQWVAWKLVQVAAKLYDTEVEQRICVWDRDGILLGSWAVLGDGYGCGVTAGPMRLPLGITATVDFGDGRGREMSSR